jgi:transcriptional regulator GlxA family with amidase domain
MKHLTILVPDGHHNLSSVVDTYLVFSKANDYWQRIGKEPAFRIQLGGTARQVKLFNGLFSVHPDPISRIAKTDLIIIPAVPSDFSKTVKKYGELLSWLAHQYDKGAAVASICTGAFMLATTGLLDGKSCSTHWIVADSFRQMFPQVNLVADKIITDEGRIYTNGGAFSFLNLLLYLIEKYFDRQTAIYCSKHFQIDIDRHSQSAFSIFTGQKNHGDDVVRKAQESIEKKFSEKISVEALSSEFSLSRRNFDRRFIKATGNTPIEYLQRVKVEAAKKAFETSRKTIQEVMFNVGYSDVKAFRETFRKITGLSPLAYRNRYNKEAQPSH